MKLVPISNLIDKEIDVGLPFNGIAPDLGYLETATLGLNNFSVLKLYFIPKKLLNYNYLYTT